MTSTKQSALISDAFIAEAEAFYKNDPLAAVHMLFQGVTESTNGKRPTEQTGPGLHVIHQTHNESLLSDGYWLLKIMDEDAHDGIAPDPAGWELNTDIARIVLRIAGKLHG